jgi:peptide/nickel transport system substrate-binding protein
MDAEQNESAPGSGGSDGGTRREFVQGAAVVGGGLSLTAFLASCGGGSNSSSSKPNANTKSAGPQGKVSKGGNFRLGVQGGGSSETLNPTAGVAPIDLCRAVLCFEPLVKLDGQGKVVNILADEVASTDDKFTKWTIKLKKGVTFHDGSPLTVDDVIWSLQSSILAKPWAAFSAGAFSNIDPKSFKKVNDLEVSLALNAPNSLFVAQLSEPYDVIYKNGTKKFDKPVGTGPFKFESWTQGERAKYLKYADWWGEPVNFDSIETVSIADPSARLNALAGGEVDAIDAPAVPQIPQIKANKDLAFIENPGGLCNIIAMSCAPGKTYTTPAGGKSAVAMNNEVRQALRYLVPREQIIQSVYAGHARIGNDLHSWFDPDYNSDLKQRPFDPEKAKSLLKAAGVSNLNDVTFVFSDINPGVKDTCTLFASACEQAGFKLPTKVVPQSSYWSSFWPNKYPISVDYWRGRALGVMWRNAYTKGAAFFETNFVNPGFQKVYDELTATGDAGKQKELYYEGQKIAYDEGGYIIPAFGNMLQATTADIVNIKTGIVNSFDNWDFTTAGFKAKS